MGGVNEMRLELSSRPENVGVARVAVAAFAGQLPFTMAEIEEIKVAVSEAVSNSVIHAYNGQQGIIRVTGRAEDEGFTLAVEDWGCGIPDVDRAREPSFSTEPERMGLGFVLMETFMDRMEVESTVGQGTTVRLWKICRTNPEA